MSAPSTTDIALLAVLMAHARRQADQHHAAGLRISQQPYPDQPRTRWEPVSTHAQEEDR